MSQNKTDSMRHELHAIREDQLGETAKATARLCLDALAGCPMAESLRIYLRGNLGSGKTTWVRSFLVSCGITGRIKSPSFSVVESYESGPAVVSFHHLDFYRQANPRDWEGGGIRDLLAEPGIVLAEWPERAQGLPEAHIELTIAPLIEASDDNLRDLLITITPLGRTLLKDAALEQWKNAIAKIALPKTPQGKGIA